MYECTNVTRYYVNIETFDIKNRKNGKCHFTQNFEKRPRQSIRLVKIRMHTIRFVLTLRKVAFDFFLDFPMFGPSVGIPNVSVFNRTPLKGDMNVRMYCPLKVDPFGQNQDAHDPFRLNSSKSGV